MLHIWQKSGHEKGSLKDRFYRFHGKLTESLGVRVETRTYYLAKWHRKHSHAKMLLSTNKARWGRKKQFRVRSPAMGRVESRLREPHLTCLGLPSAVSLSTHLVFLFCTCQLSQLQRRLQSHREVTSCNNCKLQRSL